MKSSHESAGIEARLAEFTVRCRQAGMNLTPQRLAIYRALLEARDHPSPEALFERVRPGMPGLSLGTIYKTLGTLVEMDLVTELPATGDARRYDANMQRHHHLVCNGCGMVADYHDVALDRIAPPRNLHGFRARQVSVHIHGLCAACVVADTTTESIAG